jgi:hypothetical protein
MSRHDKRIVNSSRLSRIRYTNLSTIFHDNVILVHRKNFKNALTIVMKRLAVKTPKNKTVEMDLKSF